MKKNMTNNEDPDLFILIMGAIFTTALVIKLFIL